MAHKAKKSKWDDDLEVVSGSGQAVDLTTEGASVIGKFSRYEVGIGKYESNLYHFEDEKGVEFTVWGSTSLDPMLTVAKPGDIIRVTYKGKKKTANKQNVKIFEVAGNKAFKERAEKARQESIDSRTKVSKRSKKKSAKR